MGNDKGYSEKKNYEFTLYIYGMNAHSIDALKNLKTICEKRLPNRYEIRVVDLLINPEMSAQDQIIATPTVIKKHPLPEKRLTGNLSDPRSVLSDLDIE